jgi:hypothetical protein
VGEILADLVLEGQTTQEISLFDPTPLRDPGRV